MAIDNQAIDTLEQTATQFLTAKELDESPKLGEWPVPRIMTAQLVLEELDVTIPDAMERRWGRAQWQTARKEMETGEKWDEWEVARVMHQLVWSHIERMEASSGERL